MVAGRSALWPGGLLRVRLSNTQGFADAQLEPPGAHWDTDLGEFVLDWEEIRSASDPHALALQFARSAFQHACTICDWDPSLASSAQGVPPPIR